MPTLRKREARWFTASAVLWCLGVLVVPELFTGLWRVALPGLLLTAALTCLMVGLHDPDRVRTPLESARAAEKIQRRRERKGDQR